MTDMPEWLILPIAMLAGLVVLLALKRFVGGLLRAAFFGLLAAVALFIGITMLAEREGPVGEHASQARDIGQEVWDKVGQKAGMIEDARTKVREAKEPLESDGEELPPL